MKSLVWLGFAAMASLKVWGADPEVAPVDSIAKTSEKAAVAPGGDTDGYRKFRFGGYGEILANFKDYGINRFNGMSAGNTRTHRNTISIPRFVLAMDYKFNSKWILGAEIEFEAGGTGTAVELENSENGEYETEIEKGGEVALEQFHITRLIIPAFNVRVGHMVIPIGQTNAHHEPINFFGTSRPQSATELLPCTWHSTGLAFFGSFGRNYGRFDWQAMVVAGVNANGMSRDKWIGEANQGLFETDNFTSPGYVGRIDYRGIPGLRTGVSFYYCRNAASNADKEQTYSSIGRVPVAVFTWDADYRQRYVEARADLTYGYIGNSAGVSTVNRRLSNKSPYSRLVPVAKNAMSYGAEVGFKVKNMVRFQCPDIVPFARYEYFNPQYRGAKGVVVDERLETSKWQFGLNWFALPNLVVKADYSTRQIGTQKVFGTSKYNSENEWGIGVAYVGWFIRK